MTRRNQILTIAIIASCWIPLGLLLLGAGGLSYWRWDMAENRGFHHGYWGTFNRTHNALASLPGVTIQDSWFNQDVTLEEFGFDVEEGGRDLSLGFQEADPIRTLKGEPLKQALAARLVPQPPHLP